MRRSGLYLSLLVMFFTVELYAQCGVERWSIKTGTDSGASSISLSTWTSNTIYNFYQSARPATIPTNSRVAPRETTQYSVSGTLTTYKRETDSDYHLVIQDGSGRTMIVEIPSVNCVGSGSPWGSRISNARAQFDAHLTATSSFKTTSWPVTVRGIGFWDFLHGQTGVAPNGIEVHPVLNITFNTATPQSIDGAQTMDVTVPAKSYPPDMVEDDDGGRVHVYRGGEALGDVDFHGGSVMEHPRLRVVFAGDQWTAAARQAVIDAVRGIDVDARFQSLSRYGVATWGMPVDAPQRESHRMVAAVIGGARATNDLDVQRLLATAVESGRIQHVDENVLTIVALDPTMSPAVGATNDWSSYHSLFHPTELAMPYVVLRGGLSEDVLRESLYASIARAIINPAGDGWY